MGQCYTPRLNRRVSLMPLNTLTVKPSIYAERSLKNFNLQLTNFITLSVHLNQVGQRRANIAISKNVLQSSAMDGSLKKAVSGHSPCTLLVNSAKPVFRVTSSQHRGKTWNPAAYIIETVDMLRPSKLEITQRVYYDLLLDQTGRDMTDMIITPPSAILVRETIEDTMTKDGVLRVVKAVASMLNHKRLYFLSEIYDIFTYVGGIDKIEEQVVRSVTPSEMVTERLIDFCYGLARQSNKTEILNKENNATLAQPEPETEIPL